MPTMTSDQPQEYIPVEEAAKIAGRHVRTVRRWVAEGHLTPRFERISRRMFINRRQLDHWLELVPENELGDQGSES